VIYPVDAQILIHFFIIPVPHCRYTQSEAIGRDMQVLRGVTSVPEDVAIGTFLVFILRSIHDSGPYKVHRCPPRWVGVTILPELYIPDVLPKVKSIPLRPTISRELVLAVRDSQSFSPLIAEFILHAQHVVKEMNR